MDQRLEDNFESELWKEFIELLFKKAEPYLLVRGDILHAKISHEYALSLMKTEGGNRKIIEPAVILHDVGWSALSPDEIKRAYGVNAVGNDESMRLNRIHEKKGEEIAMSILSDLGYEPMLIEKIGAIIRTHDSGHVIGSIEEAIVKDADKLWRFSKRGFQTEAERQGITHTKLYNHLSKNRVKWFFTRSALQIAEQELKNRKREFL